jgi:hypothetical protein
MNKKKVIAPTALIAACLALSVVSASAWSIPQQPVKIPPVITVDSPLQNATYTCSNVTLAFSVTQSELWYRDGGLDEYFAEVSYRLDSDGPMSVWMSNRRFDNDTPGSFNVTLDGLNEGLHSLLINVAIESPYDIFSSADPHGHFARVEIWNSTKTVTFNVNTMTKNDSNDNAIYPEIPVSAVTYPAFTPPPEQTSNLRASPSTSPSAVASAPEFPAWIILPLVLGAALSALVFLKQKGGNKS